VVVLFARGDAGPDAAVGPGSPVGGWVACSRASCCVLPLEGALGPLSITQPFAVTKASGAAGTAA